jgi:hypothetical protein
VPATKEEIKTVKEALQHPKIGVENIQRKLDRDDVQRNLFPGILWLIGQYDISIRVDIQLQNCANIYYLRTYLEV